ncbi:hypothetical protein [Bosea sp. (in: a-proteobacteria)]|uniref:hypothetical protein n=1 Tax=Bosea sp. (in: a-proteobacteria) TaxID=1871050 RepID=UPI0027350A66|nr:hypothetical protein [Bosea sp. (in: a-proteobacteria)]MDP3408058.1 hypothetical protein [Bosea sp. (in: a-proteobacteria)]
MRPLIHNAAITDAIYDLAVRVFKELAKDIPVEADARANLDRLRAALDSVPHADARATYEQCMRKMFDESDVVVLMHLDESGKLRPMIAKGALRLCATRGNPGRQKMMLACLNFDSEAWCETMAHDFGDLGCQVVQVSDVAA